MPTAPPTFGHKGPRPSAAQRGYDWDWKRLRDRYIALHPCCELCGRPAEDVDHVVPFKGKRDPNRLKFSNLMALCRGCHNSKTQGGPMYRKRMRQA